MLSGKTVMRDVVLPLEKALREQIGTFSEAAMDEEILAPRFQRMSRAAKNALADVRSKKHVCGVKAGWKLKHSVVGLHTVIGGRMSQHA